MVSEEIKLIQTSFLKGRQQAALSGNGVIMRRGGMLNGSEQTFPYDFLAEEPVMIKEALKGWAIAGVMFLIICLVVGTKNIVENDPYAFWNILVWLILASMSFMIFFFSRVKYTIYPAAVGNLVFFTDKPNREEFNLFIDELEKRRSQYINNKYSTDASGNSSIDKLMQLTYLKDKGEISQAEFDSLKRDLIGDTNEGPASRGNFLN